MQLIDVAMMREYSKDYQDTCCICSEKYLEKQRQPYQTVCKHIICKQCCQELKNSCQSKCPFCRKDIGVCKLSATWLKKISDKSKKQKQANTKAKISLDKGQPIQIIIKSGLNNKNVIIDCKLKNTWKQFKEIFMKKQALNLDQFAVNIQTKQVSQADNSKLLFQLGIRNLTQIRYFARMLGGQ